MKNAEGGFDRYQKAVIASYNDGDHLVLAPEDVQDCGDGLLKFLLVELSQGEGCDSFECAVHRLDTSIRQLNALRSVFVDLNSVFGEVNTNKHE